MLIHLLRDRSRSAQAGAAAGVFIATIFLYKTFGLAEQSHVFALLIDKFRFLLVKPTDPGLLTYESRSVWIEDFNSPTAYFILYYVSLYLPFGLLALIRSIRIAISNPQHRLPFILCVQASGFFVLFVLVRRMITIEIIFLCICMGGLTLWRDRRLKLASLFLALLLISFEGWKSYTDTNGNPYSSALKQAVPDSNARSEYVTVGDHVDVLNWIKVHTNKQQPILAYMGFSPVILAYTGRPIIVHSMFDAEDMRKKNEEFITTLYSDEESFYKFALKNGAKYFIHESQNVLASDPDSHRYLANKLQLPKTSAAYQFQFRPEGLKSFKLLYQNPSYRIFEVGKQGRSDNLVPQSVFNEYAFISNPNDRFFDDRKVEEVIARLRAARDQMMLGISLGVAKDMRNAIAVWENLKRSYPGILELHAYLCLGYVIEGQYPEAAENCSFELDHYPHSPVAHYHAALLAEKTGQLSQAIHHLNTALAIDPQYEKAKVRLAKLAGT